MNQGRDKRQMEGTYKIMGWAFIALVLSWILIFIQA
tara:strand:- start:140 stop:247 length:108 start_codon:yes stop_codon:yes gene_type:complete